MVLLRKFLHLYRVSFPQIRNELFLLVLGRFEGGTDHFTLPATFVQGICGFFQFLHALFQLETELCLQVFLDPHAKNIGIHGQDHLLGYAV